MSKPKKSAAAKTESAPKKKWKVWGSTVIHVVKIVEADTAEDAILALDAAVFVDEEAVRPVTDAGLVEVPTGGVGRGPSGASATTDRVTREHLRAVIEDARARAHAAVLDAYWRFTRCRGGRPPARELYLRRNELDERLRKLSRSCEADDAIEVSK